MGYKRSFIGFRQWIIAAVLGIGFLVAGCGKEDPDKLAAITIAATELTDAEAIEKLAQQVFMNLEAVAATKLDGGEIALTVTVHPSTDAEIKTLRQGAECSRVRLHSRVGNDYLPGAAHGGVRPPAQISEAYDQDQAHLARRNRQ